MKKKRDWFKIKKYPHIGLPLSLKDLSWVNEYVSDSLKIANHSFYPFLHRTMCAKRYRKNYDEETDEVLQNGKREKSYKVREIYYANHLDANIYSYYANKLSELYENLIASRNLHLVVTAYRKIQIPNKIKNRGMNNVDFAEEIFDFIRSSNEDNLVAITFDIKGFFDNLDHKRIKESWKKLLKCKSLPDDHYNIFKNITKFSYIDDFDLFDEFKDELIVLNNNGNYKKKCVKNIDFLRNQNVIAFCEKKDFDKRIRQKGLIKAYKKLFNIDSKKMEERYKGIPQGSPISSILANLYLIDFDLLVNNEIIDISGIYRRYSDDIVIVCKECYKDYIINYITKQIVNFNLEIQKKKTNVYLFKRNLDKRFSCFKILLNGNLSSRRRFEYLGFEFDGYHTYLKSSSLSKFYGRMKKAINRGAFYAKYSKYKSGHGKIFRRRLYKRFSYLGAKRKMIWVQDKMTPRKWVKRKKHDWGNFLTYAYMAHFNIKNSKIRGQLKNHWNKLNTLIKDEEKRINRI